MMVGRRRVKEFLVGVDRKGEKERDRKRFLALLLFAVGSIFPVMFQIHFTLQTPHIFQADH